MNLSIFIRIRYEDCFIYIKIVDKGKKTFFLPENNIQKPTLLKLIKYYGVLAEKNKNMFYLSTL